MSATLRRFVCSALLCASLLAVAGTVRAVTPEPDAAGGRVASAAEATPLSAPQGDNGWW
ncbi:hypothetical protein OG802_22975 [Streptomyces sp. NBC_00704]|uniref:hypothetical protein n=1 Tax=Streptomyces sp. NBC_00704 TaxID=2975809 RepID=UPI002E32B2A5|nr:hypothetical protein [Streptomyces sp. NBC_00704]